ncbi:MAG: hypothetical protein WBG76_01810, partial [Ornithinimicrobium sp.]
VPPRRTLWRGAVRAWARFALGGILGTAFVVGYFAAFGALDAFFEGFLFVNATSTNQVGLITFLTALPTEMLQAWGWSLWLLVGGLVLSLLLAWSFRGSSDPAGRAVVGAGAATLASLGWSLWVFNGWADAMFVVPLAAVGVGGAIAFLARHLPAHPAAALAAAYVLVVSGAAGYTAWSKSPDSLAPMRAETEAMLAAAGPEVTVQSIGAPQPLVLGGLTNPIRHQMFLTGLAEYVDETEPGGLAAIAAGIEQRRPTFVTVDQPRYYDWALPALGNHYRLIGRTAGFVWYADRDLGEDKLAEMSEILASNR